MLTTAALVPGLRSLDEQILDALDRDSGRRAADVAARAVGAPYWRCTACAREVPVSDHMRRPWKAGEAIQCIVCLEAAGWRSDLAGQTLRPFRFTTPEQRREVREILRGLERVGRAGQRGGWWRRA